MDYLLDKNWNALCEADRKTVAQKVVEQLPLGFQFVGFKEFELNERRNTIALFDFKGSQFSLVPGAEVTLGWDATNTFNPTKEQLESWNDTAEEYGLDMPLGEYLDETTSDKRARVIKPMLVETSPFNIGLERIVEDQVVQGCVRIGKYISASISDKLKIVRYKEGYSETYRIAENHEEIIRIWESQGFGIPTIDEWDTHRVPNIFGIHIAENPYQMEVVKESGCFKGGDGGAAICGGAGFFVGWLTLATAFKHSEYSGRSSYEGCIGRRVIHMDV